jgi:hypothetical protein
MPVLVRLICVALFILDRGMAWPNLEQLHYAVIVKGQRRRIAGVGIYRALY